MPNKSNNSIRDSRSWDISSILRDIVANLFKIAMIAASAAMLTYTAVSFLHKPQYTVSTTFAVQSKLGYYGAYDTATKFQTVLENNILRNKIAEEMGQDKFEAEMTANVIQSTNLMNLSVTADSPRQAFLILRSVLNNYRSVSDYVIPGIVLETIKPPTVSDRPSNQIPLRTYMIMAALLGAAFSACLVVLDSHNRDTVKNENEFLDKVDSDLLGVIYHEKKLKKEQSMLISNPLLSFRYVESYRLLASRVKGRMDSRGAKVLLVTSVLENEGKSTVASNLALALSQAQKNVLLLDCDFRKPALYKIFEFHAPNRKDLSDYILGRESVDGLIKRKKNSPLFFAFCYEALENSSEVIPNGRLRSLLDQFSGVMDYIIVDTPPMGLVADAEELIKLVDCAVMTIRQDNVLARDINDALDVLNQEENKVLGCVFSNVLPDIGNRVIGGKMSTGYYGSYGRYGKGKKEVG